MHDVSGKFARVDEADGKRLAVVAVLLEQGSGLLEEGAHLVFADTEEVSGRRAGQASPVQDGGPDDVLDGRPAVPGGGSSTTSSRGTTSWIWRTTTW
ncbi:hypothetical protein ACFRQM_11335 [Streptomyces sp. NPDC056831]|uniref:hypothetical protein n=1 Tax=Streptomyces sp. NPDC056831 TaxID=3345954 RepID=UPI0036B64FE3